MKIDFPLLGKRIAVSRYAITVYVLPFYAIRRTDAALCLVIDDFFRSAKGRGSDSFQWTALILGPCAA